MEHRPGGIAGGFQAEHLSRRQIFQHTVMIELLHLNFGNCLSVNFRGNAPVERPDFPGQRDTRILHSRRNIKIPIPQLIPVQINGTLSRMKRGGHPARGGHGKPVIPASRDGKPVNAFPRIGNLQGERARLEFLRFRQIRRAFLSRRSAVFRIQPVICTVTEVQPDVRAAVFIFGFIPRDSVIRQKTPHKNPAVRRDHKHVCVSRPLAVNVHITEINFQIETASGFIVEVKHHIFPRTPEPVRPEKFSRRENRGSRRKRTGCNQLQHFPSFCF